MTTTPTPQWQVRFIPEYWDNDYSIEVSPDGPDTWYITAAEARSALGSSDFDHLADDTADTRIPEWIHRRSGPYEVELTCTGCGDSARGYPRRTLNDFDAHRDCAPDALQAQEPPAPDVPRWPRPWNTALSDSTLAEAAAWSLRPLGDRPFTVEVSMQIGARDAAHARQLAELIAAACGGTLTALVDSNNEQARMPLPLTRNHTPAR